MCSILCSVRASAMALWNLGITCSAISLLGAAHKASDGAATPAETFWIVVIPFGILFVVIAMYRASAQRKAQAAFQRVRRSGNFEPNNLPPGFLPPQNERVLFSASARCGLPVTQTQTYGVVAAVAAASSESRTVVGEGRPGYLTITPKRVLAIAGSDVRDWPMASLTGMTAIPKGRGSVLTLRIGNVGTATFSFSTYDAARAETAIRTARAGDAAASWAMPSLS